MAEPRWVDWDGLVYYDGKVKTYIDSKLADCIKCGGRVTFEKLPPPSFENLNYIYKITDDFVSNDYFEISDYKYEAETVVKVTDFDDVYLYTIFNEVDNIKPGDGSTHECDLTEVYTEIEDIKSQIDTIDSTVEMLKIDDTELRSNIVELEDSVDVLSGSVSAISDNVDSLDEANDVIAQRVTSIENTYVTNETLVNNYTTTEQLEATYVTNSTVTELVTSEVNSVVTDQIETKVIEVIEEKIEAGNLNVTADSIGYDTF